MRDGPSFFELCQNAMWQLYFHKERSRVISIFLLVSYISQTITRGSSPMKELGSDSASQAKKESRRAKRQRCLQQLEIPEGQVTLTDVLLGKGGFADVFLADYSGINAAAKVVQIENKQPSSNGRGSAVADVEYGTSPTDEQSKKRRLFKRELEAMTRLKSSHTVHVYGAITSRADCFVLVMELMTGGDLRTSLKKAEAPLPQERVHGIMRDICFGMAFLHSRGAIHGDVKSANVLFDGSGTAKVKTIGDGHVSDPRYLNLVKDHQKLKLCFFCLYLMPQDELHL